MPPDDQVQPGWVAPRFLGGRIALDFANTVDRRLSDEGNVVEATADKLAGGYRRLLAWAEARGVITDGARHRLADFAASDPAAAEAASGEALALRETLHGLFDALADGRTVPEAATAGLDRHLASVPGAVPLQVEGTAYRHALPGRALAEPLWPVIWSVAALLVEGEAELVRRCQAPGCGWVFLDASRNRTRLWCSAELCGNRVRVRRHAATRRSGASRRSSA
jgi:predicted RNA-binding Zn ribbon-like protein